MVERYLYQFMDSDTRLVELIFCGNGVVRNIGKENSYYAIKLKIVSDPLSLYILLLSLLLLY